MAAQDPGDAIYELPLPRKGEFQEIIRLSDLPTQFKARFLTSAVSLPACSKVSKWNLLTYPYGCGEQNKFAIFLNLWNGPDQKNGYRCLVHFTISLMEVAEYEEEVASGQVGGATMTGAVKKKRLVPGTTFQSQGHHTYRDGEWDRGFQSLFPSLELLAPESDKRKNFVLDEHIGIHVSIDVRAEYVERNKLGFTWGGLPACQDVVLNCPHCDSPFLVAAGNCLVFRHGMYKDTMMQISPHASQATCEQLIRDGLIYGCGKPVRAVYNPATKEWSGEKCGYI